MDKSITINPAVSFGRPCIAGTGVATFALKGRFVAGDSVEAIAKDYRLTVAQIEAALRYELATPAVKRRMVKENL